MKLSKTLHFLSYTSGSIGVLALLGAWIARSGLFLGMSQQHLFNDAIVLILVAIWLNLSTLIHLKTENTRNA